MKLSNGIFQNGTSYNVIVNGHGTGLAPLTEGEYSDMVGNATIIDSVESSNLNSNGYYDISTQPYFPIVGNQGSQGSCAAWAMTYYDYGYLEAKDNGWTDASTGNPAHLMSPAWTYNRVSGGLNAGSSMDENGDIIVDWGVANMATMPYVATNITNWGSQDAFRNAPLNTAAQVYYISYNASNPNTTLNTIENLISSNLPVTFAIDANQFNNMGSNEVLTSSEYSSSTVDHAQCIVGYNSTMTVAGSTDVGAFKVVNSWGSSFGNKGYYWITFAAFEKIGANLQLTYITDKPSYQPKLLAVWQFNSAPTRTTTFTVGVGTPGGTTTDTPFFVTNSAGITATFPTFMALDITSLLTAYQSGTTQFYLTLGSTATAGIISSFRIEEYQNGYGNAATQVSGQSANVPMANPCSVTVSMPSYATITMATALDNSALNITGSGNVSWSPETREYYAGGSAMQSGDIGDNGKSDILTTVTGPATVSFWWKTSTQASDAVSFYVDSVAKASASGLTAWTEVNTTVTSGTHTLKSNLLFCRYFIIVLLCPYAAEKTNRRWMMTWGFRYYPALSRPDS